MAGSRQRLDDALVERVLAESRARARALILAGDVLVDGQVIRTAGKPVRPEQEIALLTDLCDTMKFGSLCALGGFTPFPVMSALKHWPEDFTGKARVAETVE